MTVTAVVETTSAERAQRVSEAIHGGEMERMQVDASTVADAEEYVAGGIDFDELVARVRARYVPR